MKRPIKFLSRTQLAERVGLKPDTLNKMTLPDHDAEFGEDGHGKPRKGWLPQTVDAWDAARFKNREPKDS